MKVSVCLYDTFGSFCANGEAAAEFRHAKIDPYVDLAEAIEIDFANVRNMNSSFCNVLIANLISQNSAELVGKLRFHNCRPNIKILVRSAIDLGLMRVRERQKMMNCDAVGVA